MRSYEKRITELEKRIPEKCSEFEEIQKRLKDENPDYDFIIGIQNGIVNCVQLPKRLTPEEWMRKYGQADTGGMEKEDETNPSIIELK